MSGCETSLARSTTSSALGRRHGSGGGRKPGLARQALVVSLALADHLLGRAAAQDALAAGVVGGVEVLEQPLEIAMAGHGEPEHLALDAAVETLDHPVRARRVGPGLAVLDAARAAELLKALGGEAAAAVGQHVGDLEGKGGERRLQESPGAGLGLVVLDRQVDEARAAVDGHEQVALAQLAIGSTQLGQVLLTSRCTKPSS